LWNHRLESCEDLSECDACFDGFTLNSEGTCDCASEQIDYYGTSCLTCGSGSYWSTFLSACVNCSANCTACDDMKTCTDCTTPFTLASSGVCKCEGYTDGDGNCVVCDNSDEYFDGIEC